MRTIQDYLFLKLTTAIFLTIICCVPSSILGVLVIYLLDISGETLDTGGTIALWLLILLVFFFFFEKVCGVKRSGDVYLRGFQGSFLIGIGAYLTLTGSSIITAEYLKDNQLWLYVLGSVLVIAGTALAFLFIRNPICE